jgi:hypothetical protein
MRWRCLECRYAVVARRLLQRTPPRSPLLAQDRPARAAISIMPLSARARNSMSDTMRCSRSSSARLGAAPRGIHRLAWARQRHLGQQHQVVQRRAQLVRQIGRSSRASGRTRAPLHMWLIETTSLRTSAGAVSACNSGQAIGGHAFCVSDDCRGQSAARPTSRALHWPERRARPQRPSCRPAIE